MSGWLPSLVANGRELLEPLLAVGKATSVDWYERAKKVAEHFAERDRKAQNWGHKVLLVCYHLYRKQLRDYTKQIPTEEILIEGKELGLPHWVDNGTKLAEFLREYEIEPARGPLHFPGDKRLRVSQYLPPKAVDEMTILETLLIVFSDHKASMKRM